MTERWTKARCERELKDPKNWGTVFTVGYVKQKSFKFFSLRFVAYDLLVAISDWNSQTDFKKPILAGKWIDTRKLFVRTHTEEGLDALREISRPDAAELMMTEAEERGKRNRDIEQRKKHPFRFADRMD